MNLRHVQVLIEVMQARRNEQGNTENDSGHVSKGGFITLQWNLQELRYSRVGKLCTQSES